MLTLQLVIQTIICGMLLGGLYVLIALGKSIVFNVMHVINVAQGWMAMLGGYATYWFFKIYQLDPLLSLFLIIPIFWFIGICFHKIFLRPIIGRALLPQLVITFCAALMIESLATFLWTADYRLVYPSYAKISLNFFGIKLPFLYVINFAIGMMSIIILHLFLTRTYLGNAIRATAQNREAAQIVGINIERVETLATSLSVAFAALAGALLSTSFALTPSIGESWTVKAIIIVTLAGFGNVYGVIPAGLLLGIIELGLGLLIPGSISYGVGLVLMLLVLLCRPYGLFGLRVRKA
ncbi:MAG: branched-chain amino acid ABC transporter permease [Candidatus Bathyarchaeia archaeon]